MQGGVGEERAGSSKFYLATAEGLGRNNEGKGYRLDSEGDSRQPAAEGRAEE